MLFNSQIFIFAFLPVAVVGYYLLGRWRGQLALLWLTAASLFFYAWWDVRYLALILFSIVFNYLAARVISDDTRLADAARYRALFIGIAANLALLGYFKYANFFVDNVNLALGTDWTLQRIILPLAISFFTFQQISYLVDSYRLKSHESDFTRFALFVSFFPQLIAGPIVHHREMLPQFTAALSKGVDFRYLAMGATCFIIGLFKKTVIADGIALHATPVFQFVAGGGEATFFDAWIGALAYTFQMYFDFSGYSDMAIGLALLFGIRLPLNFASPLKSSSMLEFWRRWHMSLGRFLQEYLFQPLSLWELRKRWWSQPYLAFIATMFLGGLWHGAAWTFVVWGLVHGVLLAVNQAWRVQKRAWGWSAESALQRRLIGYPLTFLSIVVTLTIFRADNLAVAGDMLGAMAGLNGVVINADWLKWPFVGTLVSMGLAVDAYAGSFFTWTGGLWVLACGAIVWMLPNTYQLFEKETVALETFRQAPWKGPGQAFLWSPTPAWALAIAVTAVFAIGALNNISEFLYFQF
ncbi:MAG: MBOAT family O-acyltransferase [Pseudomonadota bacterium]